MACFGIEPCMAQKDKFKVCWIELMGSTQVSSTKVLLGGIVFFSLAKVVCDE